MNENGDKLVFELKDLTYDDLILLYKDIINFETYLDKTITEIETENGNNEEEVNKDIEEASK